MANLNDFTFTQDSDVVENFDKRFLNDTLVKTLNGDDLITSDNFDSQITGLVNRGTIDTGKGNDVFDIDGGIGIDNFGIIRTGQGDDVVDGGAEYGLGIRNRGTISTGAGNDIVDGGAINTGIINEGIIRTGTGNDLVNGIGGSSVANSGLISTGTGNDSLKGAGEGLGIGNRDGTINMGGGDDLIRGNGFGGGISNSGVINAGTGNDLIRGGGGDDGITNSGIILTGQGNDSIEGFAFSTAGIINDEIIATGAGNDYILGDANSSNSLAIINRGTIDTGTGNDVIKGSGFDEFSGFEGDGSIELGKGDDLIEGFGNQTVDGGKGDDTARFDFDSSEVEISITSDNGLTIERADAEMTLTDVESFEFKDSIFSLDDGSFEKIGEFTRINFDEGDLAAGTIVTNQFEGVSISTSSPFGVMIFDTKNPTGEDDDLYTDNENNVLIISEDGDSSDPDDNADGGTISVDFDNLVTVTSLGLLDIDQPGGSIELFDDNSNLIETIEIPALGDRSLQEINLNVENVASLDINLAASGALTELNFFESSDDSTIV